MKNYLFLRREDDYMQQFHTGSAPSRHFTLWLNRINIATFREGWAPDYRVGDIFCKGIAERTVLFERACNAQVECIEDMTLKLSGTKYGVTDVQLAILAERAKVK